MLTIIAMAFAVQVNAQATIVLNVGDVWQDGSGYQMLLDADATAYGTIIPASGALSTNCSGNESIYSEFEYKIPTAADGDCSTSNIVINNTVTITIPAGTYDWCITNPTPDDRIWIASSNGNVGGRADDYVFENNMMYEFTITLGDNGNDQVDVVITPLTSDPTINVNPTALNFGMVTFPGTYSMTTNVRGFNLTGNITATTSAPYAVSADGTTFGTTASLAQAGGTLYVQYAPTAAGTNNGTVTLSATGADDVTVTLTGSAIDCSNAMPLPYTETFDNLSSCWQYFCADSSNPNDDELGPNNGVFVFSSYSSASNYVQYLISPMIESTSPLSISLDAQGSSSYGTEIFSVGYSSTTRDISAFTWLDEQTVSGTPIQYTCLIPETSQYVAIKYSSNFAYRLYIDNLSITPADELEPSLTVNPESVDFGHVIVGNPSTASFMVNRTAINNDLTISTSAPFGVSLDGTTFTETVTLAATTATIANDTVFVQFDPTMGGTVNDSITITDGTLSQIVTVTGMGIACETVTEFPFTETFDATSSTIDCWQVIDANNDGRTFALSTSGYAQYTYHSTNAANDWLISPTITFDGTQFMTFEYWSSSSWEEKFQVFAVSGETQIQLTDTISIQSSTHETMTITDISQLNGNYQIAFHCVSDPNMFYLYIDNVNIMSASAPALSVDPDELTFNGIANMPSSAQTVVVTAMALTEAITASTDAPFEVSADGTTFSDTATLTSTGLVSQVNLYVRYNPTAAGTQNGTVTLTSGTATDTIALNGTAIECNTITELPFTEDFTETSETKDCWSIVDVDNDGYVSSGLDFGRFGYTSALYAGGTMLFDIPAAVYIVDENDANDWLISPAFQLGAGGAIFAYDYITYSGVDENYSVYVIPEGQTYESATNVLPTQTVSTSEWTTNYVDLSSYANQTIRVAFKAESPVGSMFIAFTNIQLSEAGEASLTATPNTLSFTSLVNQPSASKIVAVNGISLSNDINVTTAAPFEVSTDNATFGATATIAQTGTVTNGTLYVRYNPTAAGTQAGTVTLTSGTTTATVTVSGNAVDCSGIQTLPFTENFESELSACWQIIDNDGDGIAWESSSNPASYYSSNPFSGGEGHNESDGFILSGSYSNLSGEALTPDNWLITPTIAIPANGATLAWWVAAIDGSYPADHYDVMVSTSGTANLGNFTSVFNETLTTSDWEERTVDLNSYAGQNINIAFVHNNCTDQFIMKIDDVSVTEGTGIDNHDNNVSLYPNPANNVLNVNASSNINTVEVFNMMGQRVAVIDANDTNVQINTTGLSNGMYMMRINTENGVSNQKFTVAR